MRERAAAEERALDLAAALAETRALLMDELTIRRRWWQRPQPVVLPPLPADHAEIDATPPGPPPRLAHVDGRHAVGAPEVVTPGDGTDVITFGPPRRAQVRSALLGSAVLLAAVLTVLALTGALAPALGVVAGVVTVLLAALAWRTRATSSHVRIDRGLVDIVAGDSHHRFDLRSERTQVEMVGTPGEPDWAVHFVRRSLEPVVLDGRMVNAGGVQRGAAHLAARARAGYARPALSFAAISAIAARAVLPTPTMLKNPWIWSGNRCSSTSTPASASLRA